MVIMAKHGDGTEWPDGGQFIVLNDEPVGGTDDDLMNTADTARRLADLVLASRRSTPFTLSIDAGWGMGKSSLMRQLQLQLETSGTSTIWFNAWTSGADALEVLIKSVFMRFDRNVLRRAYNRVATNNRALGVIRASLMLLMSLFGLRRLVDALWSQLSVDATARHEIHQVVRDMAQEWSNAPKETERQIVVFVDDLDRCSPEVVLGVCEAIRLYLDVPGLVFIIGCDQSALNRNLQRSNNTGAQAAEYLEKIVQVNYRAPLPDQQQARELIDGYASRSGTGQLFGPQLTNFVAERTGRNPRRIKRLINSFVLEYHLDPEWQQFGPETLVRVLLLQHFYPLFYRLLANPRGQDPVEEYLNYRNVRTGIKRGDLDAQNWRGVFVTYDLEPPNPKSSRSDLLGDLAELEKEMPEPVISLASDEYFASILTTLRESEDFDNLRRHLQRRKVRLDRADGSIILGYPQEVEEGDSLSGTHVLLVDDVFGLNDNEPQFSDTGQLAISLRESGATVDSASDLKGAERSIKRKTPDVIVSDINRHGRDNAGLEDLQYLREKNLYAGPVVFYVARITAARRKWAGALGAIGVTDNSIEVFEWVRMSGNNAKAAAWQT